MGSTWGPPVSYRTQLGPMLAQWTLLSGAGLLPKCLLSYDTPICNKGIGISDFMDNFKEFCVLYHISTILWSWVWHCTLSYSGMERGACRDNDKHRACLKTGLGTWSIIKYIQGFYSKQWHIIFRVEHLLTWFQSHKQCETLFVGFY